jgi:pimeloyl-ACP methyl ester carboxylesterase
MSTVDPALEHEQSMRAVPDGWRREGLNSDDARPCPPVVRSVAVKMACNGVSLAAQLDTPAEPVVGRCLLVPTFGLSMLDHTVLAYYLLLNGFAVLRFDASNHVGASPGDIARFTMSGLVAEISAALGLEAEEPTAVIGASLSTRAALRALREIRVAGFFAMSPVVNLRKTLGLAARSDLVGHFLAGSAPPLCKLLGFELESSRFLEDCVREGFAGLEDSKADAARMTAPSVWIAGDADRSISLAETVEVIECLPRGKLVKLAGANHELFRSPVVQHMYFAVLVEELLRLTGCGRESVCPQYKDVIDFVQRRKGNV